MIITTRLIQNPVNHRQFSHPKWSLVHFRDYIHVTNEQVWRGKTIRQEIEKQNLFFFFLRRKPIRLYESFFNVYMKHSVVLLQPISNALQTLYHYKILRK